ncbi:OLC1v1004483C1 [Oldenlandia corymbosa var. corymbosa]|uniref:OLC1v1004483C1 n=1 Tax=Oldenlandia corymbosa var. corymbosa TaxID=529605 RepID=A0AAV1DCE8_OLDCO|nr:OLC1v1004483C1 [Oldenlandia corymbosa var. corymbosa]
MPSPKSHHRRGNAAVGEKNRKGKLSEKAQSFHAGTSSVGQGGEALLLPRPRTVPNLLSSAGGKSMERTPSDGEIRPAKLTKLLLNVTIQRSLGVVQVLMSPESTVEDLITAALRQYRKEARRPVLSSDQPSEFDLHYSQFSLESLNREEKLMELGSRNFFLCPKKCGAENNTSSTTSSSAAASSCSTQAEKARAKSFGVELKPGEPLKVKPDAFKIIHISQASVGEVKNEKSAKKILLRLKIDNKDFVIGTLSFPDRAQVLFDLVLHKEFELSHDWKEGSVYLLGYVAQEGEDDDELGSEEFSEEDEEEAMQVDTPQNGKVEPEKPAAKTEALVKSNPTEKSSSKDLVKKDEPISDDDDDDDDDDEDDTDLSDDSDDDEGNEVSVEALKNLLGRITGEDDDEDDSDDDDEEDDESDDDDDGSEDNAQDLGPIKKRPAETAKAPVPAAKKAKLPATNKSGEKNPAAKGKLKGQNKQSGGQVPRAQNKPLNKGNSPNSKAKGNAPNSKAKGNASNSKAKHSRK